MTTDYTLITQSTDLRDLCAHWVNAAYLAVDTEFVRRRTYYPELGLLQIADERGSYLIDPLTLPDLADQLRPLFTNEHIVKVFHSGEEDLEIFSMLLGEPLQGGFDSQLAVGFLGGSSSQSYAGLVADELQIEVPKDQTQSNWLARPLSDAQCAYAANDVHYLYQIYPRLAAALTARGRYEWVREDVDRLATKLARRDPNEHYLSLRQAWQLKGNKLWLIQQLAAQRELRCQALNVNRKALVSDNDLVTLALKRPKDTAAIAQLTEIKPSVLRKESEWILALVRASHDIVQAETPHSIQGPLRIQNAPAFQSVRELLTQLAVTEGLPREYLVRKKDLEAVVTEWQRTGAFTVPEAWQGWRWSLFGNMLTEHLQSRFPPEGQQEASAQ